MNIPQEIFDELIKILSENEKIEKAVLIGSRARNDNTPYSDIDIVIFASSMSFSEYLQFLSNFDNIKTLISFDIIKYETIKDYNFIKTIQKEGKVIFEKRLIKNILIYLLI